MKSFKKPFLILALLLVAATVATNAACLDVLIACYDLNGSDRLCNHLYAACIQP